jgi:cytochrome c peroxidase
MKNVVLPLLLLSIFLHACQTDEKELKAEYLDLPSTPYAYGVNDNDHVPTLGRVLFYDRQLSLNNSVSCSSCHKQSAGFSDNVAFSVGFEDKKTTRNSMPIQNLNSFDGFFQQSLFWDGREHFLPRMVLLPIVNHVEMGITDLDGLEKKLSNIPYYRELFANAYGSEEITQEKIAQALSVFLTSITTRNTRFDRANRGELQLSASESLGKQLFITKYDCNSCHRVEDPNGYITAGTFANIGLDPVYSDDGLENFTRQASDVGKFKIPSLRNVTLTGPYMHDGRFSTLDDVIDHYSETIAAHPNLDVRLRDKNTGAPVAFHISDQEKNAIISFLNALTDMSVVSDQKFSNPFKTK